MKEPILPQLHIKQMKPEHDRTHLDCGNPDFDRWLRENASHAMRNGTARVRVLVPIGSKTVLGYYTLGAFTLVAGEMPAHLSKRLPKQMPIPATLMGKLAVNRALAGHGIGTFLLVDGLKLALHQSEHVASVGVVVDAINADIAGWYVRRGFTAFPQHPLRMLMLMDKIEQLPDNE